MPKKEEDEAEHPEMSDMRNVSGCESIKITVAGKGGEEKSNHTDRLVNGVPLSVVLK